MMDNPLAGGERSQPTSVVMQDATQPMMHADETSLPRNSHHDEEPVYPKHVASHAIDDPDVNQDEGAGTDEILHSADSKTASPDSGASPGGHISHLALRRGFESSPDHAVMHGEHAHSAAASAAVASTSTVSTAVPSAYSRSPFPSPGGAHAYASNGSSMMDRRTSDGSQPSMPSMPPPGMHNRKNVLFVHFCS